MAFTSTKMGLRIWNLLTDLYDHVQLADNWAKVDYHDHSPGKGVQIPTEGIADGAITGPKLSTAIDPSGAYTSYKSLKMGAAQISTATATGIYGMNESMVAATLLTAVPQAAWHFDPADFMATSRSTKLRVKCTITSSTATAPGVNFTVSMYPVTAVAAGVLTLGAAVTNSGAVLATPAANSLNTVSSIDFDPPTAGFYALGVVPSGTTAGGSNVYVRAHLGIRQI